MNSNDYNAATSCLFDKEVLQNIALRLLNMLVYHILFSEEEDKRNKGKKEGEKRVRVVGFLGEGHVSCHRCGM